MVYKVGMLLLHAASAFTCDHEMAGWLGPTQDPQSSTLTEMDKRHIVEWGVKNKVSE